jgi:acetyl-CoA C-acetyltransferase
MAGEIALKRAGLTIDDIDLFEINEAFANVALKASQKLGADSEKVNVNGGAWHLGIRSAPAAPDRLDARPGAPAAGGGFGLAAICSGGGQGDAMVIRVDP